MGTESTALFPDTGFITGMGSVANWGGSYYSFNRSETDAAADGWALQRDQAAVARDANSALQKVVEDTVNSLNGWRFWDFKI